MSWDLCFSGKICCFCVKMSPPCESYNRTSQICDSRSPNQVCYLQCVQEEHCYWAGPAQGVLWLHKGSAFIFNNIGNTCAYVGMNLDCVFEAGWKQRRVARRFYRLHSLHAVHICWLYDHMNIWLCLHRADLCTLSSAVTAGLTDLPKVCLSVSPC